MAPTELKPGPVITTNDVEVPFKLLFWRHSDSICLAGYFLTTITKVVFGKDCYKV